MAYLLETARNMPKRGGYPYHSYNGCENQVFYPTFVTVNGPAASFKSSDNQICAATDTVHFINTSDTTQDSTVRYTWYIFDSTDKQLVATNNKIGPTATYDTFYVPGRLGKFGVSLVATSLSGCKDSENALNFIIAANPRSNFDSLPRSNVCVGSLVTLLADPIPAEGKYFNYKYKWRVKDELVQGSPDSTSLNFFSYSPDSLGPYDVYLYVSNGHCNSDTTKKAFFKVIGDLTHVFASADAGCLNPDLEITAGVGREEKYPNDPAHPQLYHWFLDADAIGLEYDIKFVTPDSSSTKIIMTKSGCYPIHLAISSILDGDTCTQIYPVTGQPNLVICAGAGLDFSAGQLGCPGDTINIVNYSPPNAYGFKWTIIPASDVTFISPDTSKNLKVIFNTDTCHKIILSGSRAVNGVICSDMDTQYVCYYIPHPDFYATNPSFYCAPAVTSFINTTKNNIYANGYIWNFGDGSSYISPDTSYVSHVYQHFYQTQYAISLTAIGTNGCNKTITKTNAINLIGPVPLFTMDKNAGCDSVFVNFTNISKNVKKFYFLNGDASPPDSVSLPPHLYVLNDPSLDSIFFYPTILSLDDTLCKDYYQDTVKIYRASSNFKLQTSVTVGCVPLTVHFTATAQLANTWKWDFNGDGIIDDSVDQNPVYTYTKPGVYRAVLVASSHGQCPITILSDTIVVAPNALAGFTTSEKAFCGTQNISFKNTSQNTVRFTLDFGDGSVDSNIITNHKYYYDPVHDTGDSVSFFPKLTAYNAGGCSNTFIDTITAYRLPVAGFTYSIPTGCDPLKVNFTDTSLYNFAAEWDFDNNGTFDAYGKNVSNIYSPGLYTVKMVAISIEGCEDSAVKVNLVSVNAIPKTDFSVSDSDICSGDTVHFSNLTEPADSVVKWFWNFGESAAPFDTSSSKNPSFVYYSPGWHTVSLAAIDNRGCEDYVRKRSVFVEDTLPPQNTKLLYVSVIDSHTIKIACQKSPVHNFEAYLISQVSNGNLMVTDTETSVNDTIFLFKDSAINTNSSSYCFNIQTQNLCGKISSQSLAHCTILLAGYTNPGPGNLLSWTAYTGWNPDWYYIYRKDSSGSFKIIDSVNGSVLSWTDTALCDQTYCYYISAKSDAGDYISNSNSVCLKAKYVRQNTPLNMRFATVVNNGNVNLQWDTSAYKGLVGYLLGKYNPNTGWVDNYAFTKLNTYTDANAKVNDSSYIYRVKTIDKCGYLGPESNIGTSILLNQRINNDNVALSWNAYRNWPGGVQNYLLQVQLKNKQFKNVANLPGTDTTYTDDSVYNAIDTAYCYRVIAIENGSTQDTSISNLTCAVLPSRVFVPNAFSPNSDSLNDVWKVSALSVFNVVGNKLTQFDAKIYNRWGTLVFESNDIYKGWDGTYKGTKAAADVYIYVISASGIDDKYFQISGNLTLLR